MGAGIKITSEPEQLTEGLFGQILLWTFELLPYLKEKNIYPDWDIRAVNYGAAPTHRVIPGVVDLAYQPALGDKKSVPLHRIHARHSQVLGNNWRELSALWFDYFRIPDRVVTAANAEGSLRNALGVHYRGNDKIDPLDPLSNPVTHKDFLRIIRDFLGQHPDFRKIFLATDDYQFYSFLTDTLEIDIINLGEVEFFRTNNDISDGNVKGDRAMLDCVLLSRCQTVLLTSSALSAFAKVLNPELEIYRVAASKQFADIPYFPVSYIPIYTSLVPEVSTLIDKLMANDWTQGPNAESYADEFTTRRRKLTLRRNREIFRTYYLQRYRRNLKALYLRLKAHFLRR